MSKNLGILFLFVIAFVLPSCDLLEKREAKKEELEKREVASYGGVSPQSGLVPVFSFVRIPAGNFLMGDKGVPVEISRPFMMMTTEVTQEQWFQVTGKNPSFFKRKGDCENWDSARRMCPDHPVENVSWKDVKGYIRELNVLSGLKGCEGRTIRFPLNKRGCYRLPTDAEWEWAVRAGTQTVYFFGDDESQLGKYAIYRANSGGRTHRVKGDRLPNQNGLYDVYGNVREWVEDAWRDRLPGGKDPLVATGSSARVLRGADWDSGWLNLRSSHNFNGPLGTAIGRIGFRLVRNP
ncbi:MAG: formylglycine-generating enzyme family protein [Oligoflexia bacterium]|nr:formylglycine-generating enzyme family protein [Oligoflexia bacterium]